MSMKFKELESLDELVLPNAQLGDAYTIDGQIISRKSRGGSLLGVRDIDWPLIKSIEYTFPLLTEVQLFSLIDFMTEHVGKKLLLTDYKDVERLGHINSDILNVTTIHDICSYTVSLTVILDTQAIDYYYLITEDDEPLITEDSENLITEEL